VRNEVIRELESAGEFEEMLYSPRNAREEILGHLRRCLSWDIFDVDLEMVGVSKIVPIQPLVDWRLIDACLSAPSATFGGGGENRRAIRSLAAKYATPTIARRSGKGSGALDLAYRFPQEASEVRRLWAEGRKHPLWPELIDESKLLQVDHVADWRHVDDLLRRALKPAYLAAFLAQQRG